jgi:hypothetical protein
MTSARRERGWGQTSGPARRTDVRAVPLADASPRMQQTARNARLLEALYGTDAMLEWSEDDDGNLTWVRVT